MNLQKNERKMYMKRKMLEELKNNYKIVKNQIYKSDLSASKSFDLLENIRESLINDFLIKNNCFNTETVKHLNHFIESNDSYINEVIFGLLD